MVMVVSCTRWKGGGPGYKWRELNNFFSKIVWHRSIYIYTYIYIYMHTYTYTHSMYYLIYF